MLRVYINVVSPCHQQGAALLMVMILLVLGVSSYLLTDLNRPLYRAEAEQHTADVLSQAKAALLGFAMTYREIYPTQPPGYLPCPDRDGDGSADTCGGAGLTIIGRFPWRTLGLPPLRDGSGECLWYAVSGSYKNNPKQALTSNTDGTLIVKNALGNAVVGNTATARALAVIIAPGKILSDQNRLTTDTTYCGEFSSSTDITDYLDEYNNGSVTLNNATGNGQLTAHTPGFWITANVTDYPEFMQAAVVREANSRNLTFNDTVIAITPTDYAPVYARMNFWVANRVITCLERYVQENSKAIAKDYESVLGTLINPAEDTYRHTFSTEIERFADKQVESRCKRPKCDKPYDKCINACAGDAGCETSCASEQTTCHNACDSDSDSYERYLETALTIRAAYPWAARLDETNSGELDYTADNGHRFGRIPTEPHVGGNGDMLDKWQNYPNSPDEKCFDHETAELDSNKWGWWTEWREQVFYAIDASRSGDMPGFFVYVNFVAGHNHYSDTLSLLVPATNDWHKITPSDVSNSVMQLDDDRSNIVVIVAGRQLATQTRSSTPDKMNIRNYLEERNDPGANTIPSGDESFYTQATDLSVPFNDTACKRDNSIECEMP